MIHLYPELVLSIGNSLHFKKMHFLWVLLYLAQKFYVSYWRQDHYFFTWSSKPRKGLAICREKVVPSFLSYLKTLPVSISPTPGIKLTTSRSVASALPAELILLRFWY